MKFLAHCFYINEHKRCKSSRAGRISVLFLVLPYQKLSWFEGADDCTAAAFGKNDSFDQPHHFFAVRSLSRTYVKYVASSRRMTDRTAGRLDARAAAAAAGRLDRLDAAGRVRVADEEVTGN